MLPTSLREINEYLFYEFGKDLNEDESKISPDWPFELKNKGSFRIDERDFYIYEFCDENEKYYAIDGDALTYIPKSNLSLEELRLEQIGYHWLKQRKPIDLEIVILGDEKIPSTRQRRDEITSLARQKVEGEEKFHVLEGFYFRDDGSYLAIVKGESDSKDYFIGTDIKAEPAPCPKASAYRRLLIAIGAMVEDTTLNEE